MTAFWPAVIELKLPTDAENGDDSTVMLPSVPVVFEESWRMYAFVPTCTADAVTPELEALISETTELRLPLPAEISEALKLPLAMPKAPIPMVIVPPEPSVSVVVEPDWTLLIAVAVPSRVIEPAVPTEAVDWVLRPSVESAVPPVSWSEADDPRSDVPTSNCPRELTCALRRGVPDALDAVLIAWASWEGV